MAVASLFFLYGIWKLEGEKPGETMPLNVLLVQLNIPQEASRRTWEPQEIHRAYEEDTLEALATLERRNEERAEAALREGKTSAIKLDVPDWVVWPESARSSRWSSILELSHRGLAARHQTNMHANVSLLRI